jgi:hypothetical protein
MLASKQIPNEEVSRLREEVNGLRKLIEAGTGIKVEYLREAYQKTIMEEANENPSEEPEK